MKQIAAATLAAFVIAVGGGAGCSSGPTSTPAVESTASPTPAPSATPTVQSTPTPTFQPTATLTATPTAPPLRPPTPTVGVTIAPTVAPTAPPSPAPTPTVGLTISPTVAPTARPSPAPTPTVGLTIAPIVEPTAAASPTPEPTSLPVSEPILGSEREALVAFYHAAGGANWENNRNWLSSAPIGEWYGVTVDFNGRVVELSLYHNGLSGEIAPELGNLENLEALTLIGNDLGGGVPSELSNLSNLWSLTLSGNALTGCVPQDLRKILINDFPALGLRFCGLQVPGVSDAMDREALVALYNATDGPSWEDNTNWLSDAPIGEWYGVSVDSNGRVIGLNLYSNGLNGIFPPELGSLAALEALRLDNNRLWGEIPPELANLTALNALMLTANRLTGQIPSELRGLVHSQLGFGICLRKQAIGLSCLVGSVDGGGGSDGPGQIRGAAGTGTAERAPATDPGWQKLGPSDR